MTRSSRTAKNAPMSADAYAGFLKLWLKPQSRGTNPSSDVDAYLRYANEREPLSEASLRLLGGRTDRAA